MALARLTGPPEGPAGGFCHGGTGGSGGVAACRCLARSFWPGVEGAGALALGLALDAVSDCHSLLNRTSGLYFGSDVLFERRFTLALGQWHLLALLVRGQFQVRGRAIA